jgi:hypothetical protein
MLLETRNTLLRLVQGQRAGPRVFGIGSAKSGTHTIGRMFKDRLVSAHEMDAEHLIKLHLDRVETGDSTKLHQYILARDWRRNLKIDASQVNIYLMDDIEALFPDSLYILTVRPPLSWLRSMLDDSLRRGTSDTWIRFRDYRFGPATGHPAEEIALAEKGLHTLDGYLRYWRFAVEEALSKIPSNRCLIVPTYEISTRHEEIARFCGIEDSRKPPATAHEFRNPRRFGVLDALSDGYLIDKVERIAGDTARAVFPDWTPQTDLARAQND